MVNSEPYLPELITESNNQHATRSASSFKFQLPDHSRSANEECFYISVAKLWNNLHWLITSGTCQPQRTSNNEFLKHIVTSFK